MGGGYSAHVMTRVFPLLAAFLCGLLLVVASLGFGADASAQDYVAEARSLPAGDPGPTGDEILAEIQAAAAAAEAAAAGDEVLGVAVTSADQLAFTGGSVSIPLAAGATMIGAGGLMLLFARKRDQD